MQCVCGVCPCRCSQALQTFLQWQQGQQQAAPAPRDWAATLEQRAQHRRAAGGSNGQHHDAAGGELTLPATDWVALWGVRAAVRPKLTLLSHDDSDDGTAAADATTNLFGAVISNVDAGREAHALANECSGVLLPPRSSLLMTDLSAKGALAPILHALGEHLGLRMLVEGVPCPSP